MSRPTVNEWAAPCGCVIRYEFDGESEANGRVHTAVHHEERAACHRHAAHAHDHHAHYRALREEHMAAATKADPKHGWRLEHLEGGGVRDVRD